MRADGGVHGKGLDGAEGGRPAAAAPVLAAFTLTACFLSGGLTLAREYVSGDHLGLGGWVESGYQVVSAQQRRLAEYVSENTEPDAVFATATNHNNAIAMLTGRSIVCGAGTFLYYHGLDYQPREAALKLVYEQPAEWLDFLRAGVRHRLPPGEQPRARQLGRGRGIFRRGARLRVFGRGPRAILAQMRKNVFIFRRGHGILYCY